MSSSGQFYQLPKISKGSLVRHKDPKHMSHKTPSIVLKGPYEAAIQVQEHHTWLTLVIDVICDGTLLEKQPIENFEPMP